MLYHLGARDMLTLQKLDVGISLNQCFQYVNQMNFIDGVDILACDVRTYDRIKIKSSSYLIVHYRI